MTLQEHLDHCYAQAVGVRHPALKAGENPTVTLRLALADDPKLRAEAEAMRIGLIDAICNKCFQSRTYRNILTQALGS